MSVYSKLLSVQADLKAPKSQYNAFGKYNYRNCEDIIEAAKPHLKAAGLLLTLHDEIEFVGDRYYVKATAVVIDVDDGSTYGVSANAREEDEKKGMDGSQITGASSSYARKYALNGLFAIDDTKDSDATNNDTKASGASTKKNAPTTTPDPEPPKTVTHPKCSVCGKDIVDVKYKSGAVKKAHEIVEFTTNTYGKQMCTVCMKEAMKGEGK